MGGLAFHVYRPRRLCSIELFRYSSKPNKVCHTANVQLGHKGHKEFNLQEYLTWFEIKHASDEEE